MFCKKLAYYACEVPIVYAFMYMRDMCSIFTLVIFPKIRREVIHACQKPNKFSFISYSETVIDEMTSLSLSFWDCVFFFRFSLVILK